MSPEQILTLVTILVACILSFLAGMGINDALYTRKKNRESKSEPDVLAAKIGSQDFVAAVYAANPARHVDTLARRVIKIGEEFGELSEAYLNATSANNAKGKTWTEVREEAIDTAIVGIDVALTPQPGETLTPEQIQADVLRVTSIKLAKWAKGRSTQMAATQTVDDAV